MIKRVVPVAFSRNTQMSGKGPGFHTSAGADGGHAPESNVPLDSVPFPRFVAMPEQDLAIWTPARLAQSFVRAFADALSPAKLRPAPINKDDHA